MGLDNILSLVCIAGIIIAYLCLRAVRKNHAKDPHFAEETARRKEEYRRRTIEKNQKKELEHVLNEGYASYDDDDGSGSGNS